VTHDVADTTTHPRLCTATLRVADTPPYERGGPAAIVHLGVGAFARAHLGGYADTLLRGGHDALIRGVSLRSPAAQRQLGPQDGLYTVTECEPSGDGAPRVHGAIASVGTGSAAAAEAIAAPSTTMVTLTVTEKGYAVDEAPAVLAAGLAARDRSVLPPVIASLDNLADNGVLLRRRVLDVAGRIDTALARWIEHEVRFPCSVVDRMVPATTTADLDLVAARLGRRDDAAVIAEHHSSWTLERVPGLLPLHAAGVELVDDIGPHQRRKLWLLNLPHSALAYAGLLAGCDTIAQAAEHPDVEPFVAALVEDVLEVCDVPDARAFAGDTLRRFRNPTLGHTCVQVGADGSQKLPQRLLPVVEARRERGLDVGRGALVAALWSAAVNEVPLAGRTLPMVQDPTTTLVDASPEFDARVASARRDLERRGLAALVAAS
jgi:fructuronate reductase